MYVENYILQVKMSMQEEKEDFSFSKFLTK